MSYIGRFAPSPTGPLHMGSLVAALASWLDARAHHGQWLVRIEDIDHFRCKSQFATEILRQLHVLGLIPDQPPTYQTQHFAYYQQTLEKLIDSKKAYPCYCTRAQIVKQLEENEQPHIRHQPLIYPGTCRPEKQKITQKQTNHQPAWRFKLPEHHLCNIQWTDRKLGQQCQQVDEAVGDFIIKRSDNIWAYQLAVVADDIKQGITHVVRGEDIADNTPRQLLLYQALKQTPPKYLHVPLVKMPNGEKLSKQHGAPSININNSLYELNQAAQFLGLPTAVVHDINSALNEWIHNWKNLYLK